jgi:spore germination cell wall hydrolase CwlJ-like protein
VLDVPKTITKTVTTKVGWFGNTQTRKVTSTKMTKLTVCQFSWSCMGVKTPKKDDPRWIESQRVAMALANVDYEEYDDWRGKYANAMHFHAVNVHPGWRLKRITRVGGHIFYE